MAKVLRSSAKNLNSDVLNGIIKNLDAGDKAVDLLKTSGKLSDGLATKLKNLDDPLTVFDANDIKALEALDPASFKIVSDQAANMGIGLSETAAKGSKAVDDVVALTARKSFSDLPAAAGGAVPPKGVIEAGAKIDQQILVKSLEKVPGADSTRIGRTLRSIGGGLDDIIQYCGKNKVACTVLGGLTGLAYFMIVTGEANPIKAIARAAGQGIATVVEEVLPAVADSFAGIFQKYWWVGAVGIAVIILFMMLLKK